jgi:hypothetical protein
MNSVSFSPTILRSSSPRNRFIPVMPGFAQVMNAIFHPASEVFFAAQGQKPALSAG